jgi:hypothetical protein
MTANGVGAALLAAVVSGDPAAENPHIAFGQRAAVANEQTQLLPAQPVEITVSVMSCDDDAATQQRDRLGRELCCRQE